MGKIIHVYCDESRQVNERFMVLGGIAISKASYVQFAESITLCRAETRMFAEFKWGKVSKAKLAEYKRFVDCFFALNNTGHAHFHSLILDNNLVDHSRFSGSKEVGFYKFYYQLLLHCFGKAYCVKHPDNSLLVYLDYRNSSYSLDDLKVILNAGLRKKTEIKTAPFHVVEPRDSKLCHPIQIVDLLIGAIGFRKNGFHLLAGANKAKVALAEYIEDKSGIGDITRNTGRHIRRFTVWNFRLSK